MGTGNWDCGCLSESSCFTDHQNIKIFQIGPKMNPGHGGPNRDCVAWSHTGSTGGKCPVTGQILIFFDGTNFIL